MENVKGRNFNVSSSMQSNLPDISTTSTNGFCSVVVVILVASM